MLLERREPPAFRVAKTLYVATGPEVPQEVPDFVTLRGNLPTSAPRGTDEEGSSAGGGGEVGDAGGEGVEVGVVALGARVEGRLR